MPDLKTMLKSKTDTNYFMEKVGYMCQFLFLTKKIMENPRKLITLRIFAEKK